MQREPVVLTDRHTSAGFENTGEFAQRLFHLGNMHDHTPANDAIELTIVKREFGQIRLTQLDLSRETGFVNCPLGHLKGRAGEVHTGYAKAMFRQPLGVETVAASCIEQPCAGSGFQFVGNL